MFCLTSYLKCRYENMLLPRLCKIKHAALIAVPVLRAGPIFLLSAASFLYAPARIIQKGVMMKRFSCELDNILKSLVSQLDDSNLKNAAESGSANHIVELGH